MRYCIPFAVCVELRRRTSAERSYSIKALSHVYPVPMKRHLPGVLYAGDSTEACVSNLFAQSTWTNVGSDTRSDRRCRAQYNDAMAHCCQQPWRLSRPILIKFTSATAFRVIGENLSFIGVGDINNDCAPVECFISHWPTLFTIPHQGMESGWQRKIACFNLIGSAYPVTALRVNPAIRTNRAGQRFG